MCLWTGRRGGRETGGDNGGAGMRARAGVGACARVWCAGEKAWVVGDVVEGTKKSRMAEEITVVPVD